MKYYALLEVRGTHLLTGKITPVVDSVFKFDEALRAYDRIMSRHTRGKVSYVGLTLSSPSFGFIQVVIILDDSLQTRSPPSAPIVPEVLERT